MKKQNEDAGEGTANNRGRKPAGRAKGTGSLEKHGRVWRAVWTVDGKTYRRSTGTGDKKAAAKVLAAFVEPYLTKREERKEAAAAKRAKRDGLGEAAAVLEARAREKREKAGRMIVPISGAWVAFHGSLARRAVSAEVERIYESRWGVFAAWMERNRPAAHALADVDADTARAFMREIRAKHSPKTFNDYRALLSQVWKVLDVDAGLDGFNPWREIVPLDRATHTRRELTAEELAAVVAPLTGEMRVLFALGIYTGLRMGDAVNLTWGAVDLARGFIQWTPHKTAAHGTVVRIPLFPALASILAETPAAKRRGKILPGLAEEYAGHNQYTSERVKRVFEAAGIETQADGAKGRKAVEVGFHSLRHTFVSLCANAGVPLHIVQAIVGHTNAAMTAHYFHVSDEALRGAVAGLPDVFGGAPVAALAAPVDAPALPAPANPARAAVEAFREAGAALSAAGLTAADWREVARILAAVEKNRKRVSP